MINKCLCCNYEWKTRKENVKFSICKRCGAKNWDFGDNINCQICNRLQFVPTIHHIDGNHYNNSKLNRMAICDDCHKTIHMGFKDHLQRKCRKSRTRTYLFFNNPELKNNSEIVYRLKYLRKIWLLNKKMEVSE